MSQLDWSQLFEMVPGILCPVLFVTMVSYLLGLFVFAPLYAKADWTPPNVRYRIADILVLLVQLQLAAGLLFALMPLLDPSHIGVRVGLAAVVWITLSWWWYHGVRMLARARVDRGADRLMFLAVILPIGYAATLGMMASPVMMISVFAILASAVRFGWDEVLWVFPMCVTLGVTYGCVFLVRWYCEYIVGHARDDVAVSEGIAFETLQVRKAQQKAKTEPSSDDEIRILDEASDTRITSR